jgi:hypothetical protein
MSREHLATYLNDHLSGAVVALELLEYLQRSHRGTELARFAADLYAEIMADRRVLESLMTQHNVHASAPRKAAAWLTEKAAQVKLWLDDPGHGALRHLEILDLVSSGIEGKRLLWRALSAAAIPAPPDTDYATLEHRAEEQRQRVETHRLGAARAALATP